MVRPLGVAAQTLPTITRVRMSSTAVSHGRKAAPAGSESKQSLYTSTS